ncbi:HEAT repeat-containing protein 4 [Nowakowskiella sp. JEL0407]|nr:HEAT repeat-containing protein 4 [Nowakowskiella sp. JEL0407]
MSPEVENILKKNYQGISLNPFQNDDSPSPYKRPHRKDFLHDKLDKTKVIKLKNYKGSLTLQRELKSLGPSVVKHSNPVAAAIDAPYIPNTTVPQIRQPPKIPTYFTAQHEKVVKLQKTIEKIEETEETYETQHDMLNILRLKFDKEVLDERGSAPFGIKSKLEIFTEPRVLKPDPCINDDSPLQNNNIGWLNQAVNTREFNRNYPKSNFGNISEKSVESGDQSHNRKRSESYASRNVPYMLEVWQRVEGVNLENILKDMKKDRKHNPKKISEDKESNSDPTGKTVGGEDDSRNSTSMSPRISQTTRRRSRPSSAKSTQISFSHGTGTAIQTDNQSAGSKTISQATLRLLRKLTREDEGTVGDIDDKLKTVLMGLNVVNDLNKSTNSDVVAKNATTKPVRRRKLPAFSRITRHHADDKVVPTTSDEDSHFHIILPEFDDSDDVSNATMETSSISGKEGIANIRPGSGNSNVNFGRRTSRASRTSSARRKFRTPLSEFKHPLPQLKSAVQVEQAEHFSLAKLIILIKRTAKKNGLPRFAPKPPAHLRNQLQENPANKIPEHLGHFLSTSTQQITTKPSPESLDFKILFKTLMLCLQEDDNQPLRFEALKLLVSIQGHRSQLGRWDRINFRNTLSEMLVSGNESERLLSALTFCDLQQINEEISDVVLSRLGDPDISVRKKCIECLSLPEFQNSTLLFGKLIELSRSTSWRVREDVVELLTRWVEKFDTGKYDDVVSVPASTNKTKIDRNPKDIKLSKYADTKAEKGNTQQNMLEIREEMCGTAIEILLNLMWNDWAVEVRDIASKALSRLRQGKLVFDWIVKSLMAAEPSKRIDALRCISSLGLINANAMSNLIDCLSDPFTSVRIEACKLVCKLKLKERDVIGALLDRCHDFEWKVRVYALRAIGLTCTIEPKIKEILTWFLLHESNTNVRLEAVRTSHQLNLSSEDQNIRDTLNFIAETDKSEEVRKEVENVLSTSITTNVTIPTNTEDPITSVRRRQMSIYPHSPSREETVQVNDKSLKIPHLGGIKQNEFDIFMRDELIGQNERENVVKLIRNLGVKDKIFQQMFQGKKRSLQ